MVERRRVVPVTRATLLARRVPREGGAEVRVMGSIWKWDEMGRHDGSSKARGALSTEDQWKDGRMEALTWGI